MSEIKHERKNLTKVTALLLCLLSVASVCSCGETPQTDDTQSSAATSDESSAEETNSLPASIAALPKCDETTEITMLTTVHAEYEFGKDELSGDVVNDAAEERNRVVEDLLNVKLNYVVKPGHWADKDSFCNLISTSVMSGDGAYDIVNGVMVCVMPTITDGLYMNIYDVPNINIENDWWVDGLDTQASIAGKLFAVTGDAQLSLYKDQACMYFNRRILNENNLDDPYSLVRSGDWTLDNMTSMALTAAKDLNGDGSLTPEDDLLGYIAQLTVNRSLQEGFGLSLFTDDKNGNISFTGVTEKYADAYAKMWSFFVGNPATYIYNEHEPINAMFMSGRALFNTNFLSATDNFRDMTDDFGIVPMPKYDKAQDRYHTRIGTSTSMFFIPKTVSDAGTVGAVCEALSYYGMADVVPTWYEIALKEKYTRDEDTKEMVDLIRSSASIAFDCVFSQNMSEATSTYFAFNEDNKNIGENITSYVEKKSTKIKTELEKLNETVANLD